MALWIGSDYRNIHFFQESQYHCRRKKRLFFDGDIIIQRWNERVKASLVVGIRDIGVEVSGSTELTSG
jgi:hypothetical protein